MKTSLQIIVILLLSLTLIRAQNYSVGGGIGFGSFMGNFPSQTTLNGKLYLETPSPITVFNKLQIHLTLAQDIDKFVPDSYNYPHYSYFTSFGISGVFKQRLSESINIKEGVGIMYFNDRSFDDIDYWNFGIIISFSAETELNNSLNIFLGLDYGLTFTNTNSHYINLVTGLQHKL